MSDAAFYAALWELHRERGGGYIPIKDVEARVAARKVMPAPVRPRPLPVRPLA